MAAKYRQLATELRDAISAGEYPPGSRLPTIADIAAERGMAKTTVNNAIKLLEAQGLVHAAAKTGIVVLDRRPVAVALSRYAAVLEPGGQFGSWETACQQAGIPGRMDFIEREVVTADEDTAAILELPAAKRRIVRRTRHAMLGDPEQVVQLHTASYPARRVRGTPIMDDEKITGGVYAVLIAAGIQLAATAETVRARPATDEEVAELHLRGDSVLTVERLTRDTAGRPIELLEIVASPSRTILVYDPLPLRGNA